MAKPDDRTDNVRRLRESIVNTIENSKEAEQYLNEFGDEIPSDERTAIKEKNERRKDSVEGFKAEIIDETEDAQNR